MQIDRFFHLLAKNETEIRFKVKPSWMVWWIKHANWLTFVFFYWIKVKHMLYAVTSHDTLAWRWIEKRINRLSHGCIRTAIILTHDDFWLKISFCIFKLNQSLTTGDSIKSPLFISLTMQMNGEKKHTLTCIARRWRYYPYLHALNAITKRELDNSTTDSLKDVNTNWQKRTKKNIRGKSTKICEWETKRTQYTTHSGAEWSTAPSSMIMRHTCLLMSI